MTTTRMAIAAHPDLDDVVQRLRQISLMIIG
jgi:hypothetical protein